MYLFHKFIKLKFKIQKFFSLLITGIRVGSLFVILLCQFYTKFYLLFDTYRLMRRYCGNSQRKFNVIRDWKLQSWVWGFRLGRDLWKMEPSLWNVWQKFNMFIWRDQMLFYTATNLIFHLKWKEELRVVSIYITFIVHLVKTVKLISTNFDFLIYIIWTQFVL